MIPITITLSSIVALILAGWGLISVSQKAYLIFSGFKILLDSIALFIKLVLKGELNAIEDIHNLNMALRAHLSVPKLSKDPSK